MQLSRETIMRNPVSSFLALSICALLVAGCGEATSTTDSADAQSDTAAGNGSDGDTPGEGAQTDGDTEAESASVAITPENTKIEFVGSKPDGSRHEGGFREFSGKIELRADRRTVEAIQVDIQTQSLWADNAKLENHLKSPDFFTVREHPRASFRSTAVETTESGQETVTGDLTLLGETKEIAFPATVTAGEGGWKLESGFPIDRTRFGMNYGEGEINKEVDITVIVETGGEETPESESSSDESR